MALKPIERSRRKQRFHGRELIVGKLDGKVAIVTGGGRGIGRAVSEGFVKEGARVVVTAARERQEIESLVSSAARSDQTLALLADVTDPRTCERVVSETIARFGRLDVLGLVRGTPRRAAQTGNHRSSGCFSRL